MKKVLVLILLVVSVFALSSCDTRDCVVCEGRGIVLCSSCEQRGRNMCALCEGTGHIGDLDCVLCGAWGYTICSSCNGRGYKDCFACNRHASGYGYMYY